MAIRHVALTLALCLAVPVAAEAQMSVTPANSALSAPMGSSQSTTFTLQTDDPDAAQNTIDISCDGAVVSCSTVPWVMIQSGNPVTITVNYTVSNTTGATGNITVSMTDQYTLETADGAAGVTVQSSKPHVSANPTTQYTGENVSTNYPSFVLANTGDTPATYAATVTCSGASNCSVRAQPPSSMAPGASASLIVDYQSYIASAGNESLTLHVASQFGEKDSATVTVVPLSEAVRVTPGTAPMAPQPSQSASYPFTIAATGNNTSLISYTLTTSCTGALSCGPSSPTSVSIAPGSPATATVSATAASSLAGGAGTVTLTASYTDGWGHPYSSTSTFNVTVPDIRSATVQVTPDADSTAYNEANVATSYVFKVKNTGTVQAQYDLSILSCTGTLNNGCSRRYSSVIVGPGQTGDAPVDFTTLGMGQNAHIKLRASVTATWGPTYTDSGSVTVVPLSDTVSVTATSGTPSALTNVTGTYNFTVRNAGNDDNVVYTLQIVGCTAPLTNCSTQATVTLNKGQVATMPVAYQTGSTSGTGQITLRAYVQRTNLYQGSATGAIAVNSRLGIATSLMNNTDQDVRLCVNDCFAVTASKSSTPYYTLGTPRSITLTYNSDRAFPRPFVYADVTIPNAPANVQEYRLEVRRSGSNLLFANGDTVLHFAGTSTPDVTYRLGGQLDMRTYGNGVYPVQIVVTAIFANGVSDVNSAAAQLLIVNTVSSSIARGWAIAGVERLVTQPDGSQLVFDGDGSAWVFAHKPGGGYTSPIGDLTTLTDTSAGRWVRTSLDGSKVWFSAGGLQDSVTDRLGRKTVFEYDASSRLSAVIEPMRAGGYANAPYLSLAYGSTGLSSISEVGAAAGRTTTVTVDANGALTRVTDPDGGYESYGYDAPGRLSSVTNRKGAQTQFVYDSTWKLAQVILPAVAVNVGSGATAMQQPTLGYSAWQSFGVPLSSTALNPALLTIASPPPARQISPTGDTTTYTVNSWGEPLTITDALNRVTTIVRSGVFPTTVQYPDGSVDSATFVDGLLVAYRRAGRNAGTVHYGVFAQPDSSVGGGVASRRLFLSPVTGNVDSVRHAGPTPNVASFTYDALGRLTTATDEAGHSLQFSYDPAWGNLRVVTAPNGATDTTVYDSYGRDSIRTNGRDSAAVTLYDLLNRRTSTRRGLSGEPIQAQFDGIYPTAVTDRNGNQITIGRNALGWETSRCDAAAHCSSYLYDASGRLTAIVNRRGQRIDLTYDRLGRLLSKSGTNASTDTFSYASDSRGVVASNDIETDSIRIRPGTSSVGSADTTIVRVDGMRLQILHGDLHSWAGIDSTVITSSAPGVTFRKRYLYADTSTGMLQAFGDGFNTTSYSYSGDWLQTARSNVSIRDRTYLPTHALLTSYFSAQNLIPLSRAHHFDKLGRANEIFTNTGSSNPSDGAVYQYDGEDRLAQSQVATGCQQYALWGGSVDDGDGVPNGNCTGYGNPDTYTYDGEGNRTSQGGSFGVGNRVIQSNGLSYEHDLDGNVTRAYNASGVEYDYTWSADNRLTDVSVRQDPTASPTLVHYDYNARGEPVVRTLGSSPDRVWLRDRSQLLGEFNPAASGQRIGEYLYDGEVDRPYAVILGATAPTSIHYIEWDAAGNVVGTHDGSTLGMTVRYGDWGSPSIGGAGWDSRLLWKGLQYDEYTGLYYARARWYDPNLGRFLSEDPAGLGGGINPYVFAADDPVNGTDPSGTHSGLQYNWTLQEFAGGNRSLGNRGPGIILPLGVIPGAGPHHDVHHEEGLQPAPDPIFLFVGGVEVEATEGAAEGAITFTEERLAHVVARHTVGGSAVNASSSIFQEGEDLVALIRHAETFEPVVEEGGQALRWHVDAGRIIGNWRTRGPTSWYTVITSLEGRLITMYPGFPKIF